MYRIVQSVRVYRYGENVPIIKSHCQARLAVTSQAIITVDALSEHPIANDLGKLDLIGKLHPNLHMAVDASVSPFTVLPTVDR
jgi:hypothetical protein